MEDWRFGKQDLYKIFAQVLKNIDLSIAKYHDYVERHALKNHHVYKGGLWVIIWDSIYELYPQIGRDYRHLLEARCEEIIYKATNVPSEKNELYWHKFDFTEISAEEFYEPRIKCVKDTIKYLKNLN